jgi:nucleoid-associated protein YgaU
MHRLARIARLVAVMVFEAGALGWLLHLGRRPWLRIRWSELGRWLRVTPAEDALVTMIWLAAIGCVIWLAGSTLLYLAARASRMPVLIRSVEWMTLPVIRRVSEGALAAILATATMPAPPAWADPPPPIVVVVDSDGALLPPGLAGHPANTRRETLPLIETSVPPLPAFPHETRSSGEVPRPVEVTVEAGDNLWIMSRRRLTAVLGRRPTNQEIAPYWRQVISHNQPHLISGDPDLIYAGEVVEMPPTG